MTKDIELKVKVEVAQAQTNLNKIAKAENNYRDAISETGQKIRSINKTKQDTVRIQKLEAIATDETAGYYNRLSAQMSLNKIELKKLSEADLKNVEIGGRLQSKIKSQNDELKKLDETTGNHTRNVGNYTDGVKNGILQSGLFGKQIAFLTSVQDKAKNVQNAFTTAQKAGTASTTGLSKGLKVLKFALISTGIGAIVVAVGALVAAFASTQKGADKISKALAPLKGAFESIIGVVQDLSTNVFGQLSDRWTIAVNSIALGVDKIRLKWNELTGDAKDVAEIQADIVKRTKENEVAQERLNEKTKAFTSILKNSVDRIKEGADVQSRITQLTIEADQLETGLNLRREKALSIIKEQELIAKDRSNSDAKRYAAANRAIAESNELEAFKNSILDKRIEAKKLENTLNDTDRGALKEQLDLEAQRYTNAREQRRLEMRFLGLRNEVAKEKLKELDDYEKSLNLEDEDEDDTEAQIIKELDAKKAVAEKIKEWEKEQENIKADTDKEKYELEQEKLQERTDLELEQLQDKLDKKLISEQEFKRASEALEVSSNAKKQKINLDYEKSKAKSEEIIHKQKVKLANQTTDALIELFGKESTAGKALAIAKATMNTYQGVTEVWRAPSLLPEPLGTAGKVVSTGVVLASGFQSINAIKSQKFATGGVVQGPTTGDTVPIMANGEEMILTKQQQANLFQMANNGNGQSFDYERLASLINDKQVVVLESDITEVQKKVEVRESEFQG